MRANKPNSKRGAGKSGKRVPFTIDDDKELIRWCLAHGDGRPSFEKAVEQGVCPGHGVESLRGRCRNHAMTNVALVAQVEREIERANKSSAASPGKKAADEPFTQAQSESENDDDFDDFAAEEARQEEERRARAKNKQKRKQQQQQAAKAEASPPRQPTAQAQAALAAARVASQEWEALANEPEPAAHSKGRRDSAAEVDNDDDLVGQLLSNADHGREQDGAEQAASEEAYGSDDDLVDSLLNESSAAAAPASAPATTAPQDHPGKRGRPSAQTTADAAPASAASSRKKRMRTAAGNLSKTGPSAATSARDVIDMLANKAQCSRAVAIHALLVCTGVPTHAYAYLIGKNDGNLPQNVHVWTCEEDKVMQAVSNALLSCRNYYRLRQ